MSRRIQWAILFIAGIVVGCVLSVMLIDVPKAAADYGNPYGHRAGGRFDYIQYDDNILVDADEFSRDCEHRAR